MENIRARNWLSIGLAALIGLFAGCGSTPPASTAGAPAPAAAAAAPSQSPWPFSSPGPRIAARDPALDRWKRSAAERIHEKNRDLLFEGRPHHLLQAVIVVEVAVDKSGNVTRSRIMRSPGIASLNDMALRTLKTASPLPAPPAALVAKGSLVYWETWLVNNDSRFQLRTLAMPQE
jgi:protein TonB